MKLIYSLLTPFVWIYYLTFKMREKLFGYVIEFEYLPKEISNIKLPVHMDPYWYKKGYIGRNVCHVPKGHPYSNRFNEESEYFQCWVGTYYLETIFNKRSKNIKDKIFYLVNSAVEDQNEWLKTYGFTNPYCKTIKSSVKLVEENIVGKYKQTIFYGEMITGIDESINNVKDNPLIHVFSVKTGELYSKSKANMKLLQKDHKPSLKDSIKLFGYFGIIEITPKKYILNYVCGTEDNKEKINISLLDILRKLRIKEI